MRANKWGVGRQAGDVGIIMFDDHDKIDRLKRKMMFCEFLIIICCIFINIYSAIAIILLLTALFMPK